MNRPLFTPLAPDAPHPFTKDGDGGPLMGGSTEHWPRGRALHRGMTAGDRIRYGHGTPEDLVALRENQRRHREWKASPAGREWLAKKGL